MQPPRLQLFSLSFMVSELVIPTLLGLYWFKEKKQLVAKEKAAILIGAAGSFLIAYSF